MICLGLAIGIILIILGFCIKCFTGNKFISSLYHADLDNIFKALGLTILVIVITFGLILCGFYTSSGSIVDEKIAMYEEENIKIENQIDIIVKEYQKYEVEVYDTMTAAMLFPELASNTLVQKQIEIYVNNNQQIKALKENKLNHNLYGWWLFFKNGD